MNENGYPIILDDTKQGCTNGMQNNRNSGSRCQSDTVAENGQSGAKAEEGCGGEGCPHDLPLAYVYAPDQKFRLLFSAPDALAKGTLFEELYKPMGVYGNE